MIRFNGHLRKKGISGQIKVSYEEKTLSVEVSNPIRNSVVHFFHFSLVPIPFLTSFWMTGKSKLHFSSILSILYIRWKCHRMHLVALFGTLEAFQVPSFHVLLGKISSKEGNKTKVCVLRELWSSFIWLDWLQKYHSDEFE